MNAKLMQMLKLSDTDFEAAIIKMLRWAIANMLETNEKPESLSKETANIKRAKRKF